VITITIVTPWQNHRELERDYFAAVRCVDAAHLIVDDGSEPRLPNALRYDYYGMSWGFARVCNYGLEFARTDSVLFLNNDIVALEPNWIEPIRDALEPGVLVGAELRMDPHGAVDGEPMPYLDGWCLAGMTNDLRDLGGFDETFDEPSYFGDNDLCLRARAAGMTLREARVPLKHLRNATTGGADNPKVRAATIANRDRFIARARELMGAAA
jgi:GT2 family glycosyltransferase